MRLQVFLAFLFSAAIALPAFAQYSAVEEVDKSMSFGVRPGFSIRFSSTDKRVVDDAWADFVKNNFGGKLKKGKKGESYANELQSSSVSTDAFTLYSQIEKASDGTQFTVWFDVGSHFLNHRDDLVRTNDTKAMLQRFYFDVRRAAVGLEVKAEEEKMKDLESRLKKLQRDNTSLNKDIETYKVKIKKAEDELVKNQKDQETTIIDIDKQRRAVEEARQRQGNVENERQ